MLSHMNWIYNKKIAYVTQTTLSVDDTKNIIKALKKNFHKLKNHLKRIFVMQLLIVNQLLKILPSNVICFLF